MTFLKKLGEIIAQGSKIAGMILPFIPNVRNLPVERITDTLNAIINVIVQVEAIGAVFNKNGSEMTGEDKLKAATPLVAQIILQSDVVSGKRIENQTLFMTGVKKITNGVVDVLNSLKDEVTTESTS
jgi:hypothetical protein